MLKLLLHETSIEIQRVSVRMHVSRTIQVLDSIRVIRALVKMEKGNFMPDTKTAEKLSLKQTSYQCARGKNIC